MDLSNDDGTGRGEAVSDVGERNRHWRSWALGAGFVAAAIAVFFALGASMAAGVAMGISVVVLLLGAASVAIVHRLEGRAGAAFRGAFEAAAGSRARDDETTREQRAERDRLLEFFHGLPVGCYSRAADGRIRYVNDTLAGWLGATASDLTGAVLDVRAVAAGDAGPAADRGDDDGLLRDARDLEVELRVGDGKAVRGLLTQTVVAGAAGAPVHTHSPGHTYSTVRRIPAEAGAKQTRRQSERRFSRFFEAAPIGIALVDLDGAVVECNRMFRTMTGALGADPVGGPLAEMVDERDRADLAARLGAVASDARGQPPLEVRLNAPDEATATVYASPLVDGDGKATGVILHLIDTTEQKNLELQFFQSQKMHAVGQLAGGIAHDFNNLLTAMMGFCDLLLMRHKAGDQSFADIMQIKQNVNRAAGLVRQLLAFSRRQTLQPKVLALTDVLAELTNLLRRLIGENIELNMIHARNLGLVKVDQGQIEQVIINLAVNARDAMADGGTLTIRTSNVAPEETVKFGYDLVPPADYVLIEVSDTGVGIPKAYQGKIFDPFFSTKEVGAGTGLGLSTVYGIVKQTGGYIFVESAPDAGAVFSIFVPRHVPTEEEAVESRTPVKREPAKDLTGKGTIVLVEDEDSVRTFGARALRGKGYKVLEADSGEAALEVIGSCDETIELLITDVVMPQMDGVALVERVRENWPDLKVIFISGYAEEAFRDKLADPKRVEFLPKPFSLAQLAGKVKDVIEAPKH